MTKKQQLYEFKVHRKTRAFDRKHVLINGPDAAGMFLLTICKNLDREHFYAIYLDVRGKVIGYELIAIGGLASVEVAPREMFRGAILAGAFAIVIGHNHPSGDPEPSSEDLQLTKRMMEAGQLLGIEVMDSIIAANEETRSVVECLTGKTIQKPTSEEQ